MEFELPILDFSGFFYNLIASILGFENDCIDGKAWTYD